MSEPVGARPSSPDWVGGSEQLPWSWAVERLTDERNYWLVSVRTDGFPQARPLWGVWLDDLLYLSVGQSGLQRAGKRPDGGFDVSVHVDSAVDVVIVEGKAERVRGKYGPGERKVSRKPRTRAGLVRAGELYEAKYEYAADFVNFVVTPSVVYGWRSEDVGTATRWTFG